MRLVMGSDHAGFELKEAVKALLEQEGHEIVDVGCDSPERTDYPPFAAAAGRQVAGGEAERGVLMCGSGVGVAIAANKVDGVRAVNAHDPDEAEMARRHNDANVVTLSGGNVEVDAAHAIVRAFLTADFEGGRHAQRVEQIGEIEQAAG
ncbi:MAG: ribose 5-phosphate isomerase B [Actinomycetota bacterium]|nr:ribose 5-phosphate isomerase B [Actinomycetota bacterium]